MLICQFTLEVKLQRNCTSRGSDMQRLAECAARDVAIHAVELRMVPDIEDIARNSICSLSPSLVRFEKLCPCR